ncbi:MAG: energy-coupling factor transporter ATPase [Caldisericia bacterium]|nr:energy-coupling factor transporter ATPase [Caldisericia bacterium]
MSPFIEVNQVSFHYPENSEDQNAVQEIHLNIESGEFLSIVGANSSGKSTLGRLINALYIPQKGTVKVNGMLTSNPAFTVPIRKTVQMVFQNPDNQIVATTVEEEIAFGPENLQLSSDEIQQRVNESLKLVDLESYRLYPPHLLSGGQKQLLAIASVLAMKPDCIIFDEPTSLLDPVNRRMITKKIQDLDKIGITIIYITHRMDEVLLSERSVVMNEGKIVYDGKPTDLFALDQEKLISFHLYPPDLIKTIEALKKKGIPFPTPITHAKELADYLCQLK